MIRWLYTHILFTCMCISGVIALLTMTIGMYELALANAGLFLFCVLIFVMESKGDE